MSSKPEGSAPNNSTNAIVEELKLTLRQSRRLFRQGKLGEAKQVAEKAQGRALKAGLVLEAQVLEAQALICDKRWDDAIASLADTASGDLLLKGQAWDRLGLAYSRKGNFDKVIECYRKALAEESYDTPGGAWHNMGIAYGKKRVFDKAIEYFQKALAEKSFDSPGSAWQGIGAAYAGKKDFDKAIEYFQKALAEKSFDSPGSAWQGIGAAYAKKKDFDKAIEYFQKALADFQARGNREHAKWSEFNLHLIRDLKARLSAGDTKGANELGKLASGSTPTGDREASLSSGSLREMKELVRLGIDAYGKYANKRRESNLDDVFVSLKGWSSAIPALADATPSSFAGRACRGGGYFIKANGSGLVLDPGFDFLHNFHTQGFHLKEVRAIAVTHDHSDHQDDLRRISDLDYEYRGRLPKGHVQPPVKYFLDRDTDHRSRLVGDARARTKELQKGDKRDVVPGMTLTAFGTQHGDNRFVTNALGCVLDAGLRGGGPVRIGYTSDTGYFDTLPSHFEGCGLLVCHFSSTDADDLGGKLKKKHLGYTGLTRLICETTAELYVVSEFWGGIGDLRIPLIKQLRLAVKNRSGRDARIIAGDIGLVVDLRTLNIRCSRCKRFAPYEEVTTAKPEKFDILLYLCDDCRC